MSSDLPQEYHTEQLKQENHAKGCLAYARLDAEYANVALLRTPKLPWVEYIAAAQNAAQIELGRRNVLTVRPIQAYLKFINNATGSAHTHDPRLLCEALLWTAETKPELLKLCLQLSQTGMDTVGILPIVKDEHIYVIRAKTHYMWHRLNEQQQHRFQQISTSSEVFVDRSLLCHSFLASSLAMYEEDVNGVKSMGSGLVLPKLD